MTWKTSAPRVMIRKLREVMAKPDEPQARLNSIVKLIAANMVAEVSSIYVQDVNGDLELHATEGLKQEAVHTTRLKRREGLVGMIADRGQPVNLTNAQSHPSFSYKPETGEEKFHSFLGVPILRNGRTLGVLTVQNVAERKYEDDEVEALQITAMVLAEMLGSGGLVKGGPAADPVVSQSKTVNGHVLSEGIALGHVVFHEPRVGINRLISDNPAAEILRLDSAMEKLKAAVLEKLNQNRDSGHHDILEVYLMAANDRGWYKRLKEAIEAGFTAEAAVEQVQVNMRLKLGGQDDSLLAERLHDLDDLANRLLKILTGRADTTSSAELPLNAILVARNMGAAELLDYDRTRLKGLVIEEGGPASHVAIVARALGIPAVGQTKDLLAVTEPGDPAVLDAINGRLHLRPSLEVMKAYTGKERDRDRQQRIYERLRDVQAVTQDGQRINLLMNAGLTVDLPQFAQSGADGIGLFRTELQFMISSTYPKIPEQANTYRKVLEAAGAKPVVFRSLDIGGDKLLTYHNHSKEENPALGVRAIRLSLDRPGLFRSQIRALLMAAAGRELRIMLPFITTVAEFREARRLIDREIERLRNLDRPTPAPLLVGAMVEVPALLWQLPELLPLVNFISIGSNDLMQFFFAADRENPKVSTRFDPLCPAAMRMLRGVLLEAERYHVPVTLCGEMAGKPLDAMGLIGIGFKSISMAASSLGAVKAMVLSINARHLQSVLLPLIEAGETNLRQHLREYAAANDVNLPPSEGVSSVAEPSAMAAV